MSNVKPLSSFVGHGYMQVPSVGAQFLHPMKQCSAEASPLGRGENVKLVQVGFIDVHDAERNQMVALLVN